ncbi:serine hydrolase [Novosphingobium sp. FKTRR1]|uniref:serine hydrolase domain-containing protein n=1 Tax=Novosphingobium sp. FKTRR1 TaxID=2879118 RepID=UPI001CF056AD|nr:serine hydrolase domain-containing protein [Novosphingobium sp. FKTRR1]
MSQHKSTYALRPRALLRAGLAQAAVCALLLAAPAPTLATPVAADTVTRAPSGVQFVVPKGWELNDQNGVLRLSAPGEDPFVAIVTIADASGLDATVVKAEQAVFGDRAPTPGQTSAIPPENGWTARRSIAFASGTNANRVVSGLALKGEGGWTVAFTSASSAGAEKWFGALRLVSESLQAPGYVVETLAGRTPHRLGPEQIEALRSFLKTGMAQLGIPGAAFALVDHGKVVAEDGLGVKDLRYPAPVTGNTMFQIASNTKGMTTLLLSKLVDEGRITWNEPVTEIYPDFRLGSAETTSKVEVRHLVCACTGMPRKDLDWVLGTDQRSDPAVTFRLLATTEPTSQFGQVFQYSNTMAAAAGFVAGHVLHPDLPLGKAYDLAMQEKIFDPIGMTQTTFDFDRVLTMDHAWPHGFDRSGKPATGTYIGDYKAIGPAGAAWSSVHDMIKYAQIELGQGRAPDGRVLFSQANLLARRRHGMLMGKGEYYGMGLATKDYGGVEVVHHSGGSAGFASKFAVIPEAQIGMVLLTNSEGGGGLIDAFERRVIEIVYDAKPRAAADVAEFARRAAAMTTAATAGSKYPPSEAAANALAAHYTSPDLGKIDVRRGGGQVFFNFGMFESRVAEIDGPEGMVSFACTDPASFHGTFVAGTKDGHPTLTIRDGQHEYVYVGQ